MSLVSLYNYSLSSSGSVKGIRNCTLSLEKGEVRMIETDSENDAHLLLRGLATLTYPTSGDYLFDGNRLDFSDYRNLLSTKKRIGYLASDTALISNRSIRDNLSISQAYFENNLTSGLSEEVLEMCREFSIDSLVDYRPVNLGNKEQKNVMVIRELAKMPDLMLIEYPEEFAGAEEFFFLISRLERLVRAGMTLVCLSDDETFNERFSGTSLVIKNGTVTL